MRSLRVRHCGLLLSLTVMSTGAVHAADLVAPAAEARTLYEQRCGICHAAGGTGTLMLGRRLGAATAQLAVRTDLSEQVIRYVVRSGINSMPVFTRAELTDGELALVVAWLTRPAAARTP